MEFSDFAELMDIYIEESTTFLDRLEEGLLRFEAGAGGAPDASWTKELLALLHTFKGNSGMMGLVSLEKFAHRLEDIFKALQKGEFSFDSDFFDLALRGVTTLRRALAALSAENPTSPPLDSELAALDAFLAREKTPQPARHPPPGEPPSPFVRKSNLIRVHFDRIDSVLKLVGELMILQAHLGDLSAKRDKADSKESLLQELGEAAERMARATTDLYEAVLRVRMLPIRQVFSRFPRLVRELSRERGREVRLVLEGVETEADKMVMDELGEPLLHLVRNALDHGIESPEERTDRGKPREAVLTLRAAPEGRQITIQVEDDGRGIDGAALAEKAVRQGLISPRDAERLELIDLLMLPGLSSAKEVSAISGRGLGMDSVRRALERLNGLIEVSSRPGEGAAFTLSLPLTLAIIPALFVETAGERLAIPQANIVECRHGSDPEVQRLDGRAEVTVRETLLPLVDSAAFWEVSEVERDLAERYVVVLQSAAGQAALLVDRLMELREIMVEPPDAYLAGAPEIAGTTTLGDGSAVMVLDVSAIIEQARSSSPETVR
jgi:two-component system, chemotaxis family, sensor kinase CheA